MEASYALQAQRVCERWKEGRDEDRESGDCDGHRRHVIASREYELDRDVRAPIAAMLRCPRDSATVSALRERDRAS